MRIEINLHGTTIATRKRQPDAWYLYRRWLYAISVYLDDRSEAANIEIALKNGTIPLQYPASGYYKWETETVRLEYVRTA